MSADAPWSPLRLLALAAGAALLAGGAGWLDLAWGGLAAPGFEELLNARAALLVACGHGDRLLDLQYRNFCGGCTADALLGAPLLRLGGATLGSWKLVPLGLHALTTFALVALAGRAAGWRGAGAAALLVLGAPAAWRELALTGWGNHAESAAFTFGAAALAVSSGRRWWLAGFAGLLAGLGLWYAWISAHALPALVVAAVLTGGPRALGAFLLALPIGVLPLVGFQAWRPSARPEAVDMALALHPAPPDALLRWLVEPVLPGRLWPHGDGPLRLVGAAIAGATGLAGLAGALLGLADREHPARGARLFPLLGLAGLLLAFALRHDLWSDTPPVLGYDMFNLRYRGPLFPLLAVGAGVVAARYRPAAVLVVGIAGFGLFERVRAWSPGAGLLRQPLAVASLGPDPTMPEGTPPRRNAARMGRPQDLRAAEVFIMSHDDALPRCEDVHAFEVGRRIGLWVQGGRPDGAPDWARATCQSPPTVPGLDPAVVEDGWHAGCGR